VETVGGACGGGPGWRLVLVPGYGGGAEWGLVLVPMLARWLAQE
jgi:hypothetical protein